mgnify:CR=1 FL=1
MPTEEEAISSFFAEFSQRLADLEENLRLLKEKFFVTTRTFLKANERLGQEVLQLKEKLSSMKDELDRTRAALEHIIRESASFVRREEFRMIEKRLKLFDPLKFVTEEELKKLLKKQKEN